MKVATKIKMFYPDSICIVFWLCSLTRPFGYFARWNFCDHRRTVGITAYHPGLRSPNISAARVRFLNYRNVRSLGNHDIFIQNQNRRINRDKVSRVTTLLILYTQKAWGVPLVHCHSHQFPFFSQPIRLVFLLTFRHRASCFIGQGFRYSPENAFYVFNQQIYFII